MSVLVVNSECGHVYNLSHVARQDREVNLA